MREILSALRMLLTLRCHESSRLLSDGRDRELSRVENWALRLHFLSCKSCRAFRDQLELVNLAAKQMGSNAFLKRAGIRLSDDARQRIRAAISGDR